MQMGRPSDIPFGGACSWQLPADSTCAERSRTVLQAALTELRLPKDLIDDVLLCASELATNAYRHCAEKAPSGVTPTSELWLWARAIPSPQLVLAVFDNCRAQLPEAHTGDPLDESGRGLDIVAAIAADWGSHPSRSRLGTARTPGKAVWCAFPTPDRWPPTEHRTDPARTAHHLTRVLSARGLQHVTCRNDHAVSLVIVPVAPAASVNIWIEPKHLTYSDPTRTRRPLRDLSDLAEHLIRRAEEATQHLPRR